MATKDEHLTTRVSDQTESRLQRMVDDTGWNQTEAHRRALDRGLEEYGYGVAAANAETRIETTTREFARALLYVAGGLVLSGFWAETFGLAVVAVPFIVAAALLWAVAAIEPNLTNMWRQVES